jgi:hypothetical protein
MGRRTLRTDYDLPPVPREHHAFPGLADEQGREALRVGLELQHSAVNLDPQHARAYADALRRRRVIRLSALVFALEAAALLAVSIGQAMNWWPA